MIPKHIALFRDGQPPEEMLVAEAIVPE